LALAMEITKKECKMKQLIIITILSLSMINCKGQQNDTVKQNNIKKDTMEYFNENKYKDWEFDQKHSFKTEKYYKKDNQIVRIILFYKDEIAEEMSQINSPFKEYKYYHKNTLLKNSIKQFYDFSVGITKEYDESGKLIKETNWDKNYPFKVEDLCKLIKEEYGVDLMVISEPNKNSVERRYDEDSKKHCYVVIFRYLPLDEGNDARFKEIFIDGETGKILYEDGWTWGDLPKSKTPVPIKGEKEKKTSGVYKTHEGKNYTKAEWEAYEEKQYEEYCKRTGRPYTPQNQEPKPESQDNKKSFLARDNEQGDENAPKKNKGFLGGLFS
jgi:hypothetical protein